MVSTVPSPLGPVGLNAPMAQRSVLSAKMGSLPSIRRIAASPACYRGPLSIFLHPDLANVRRCEGLVFRVLYRAGIHPGGHLRKGLEGFGYERPVLLNVQVAHRLLAAAVALLHDIRGSIGTAMGYLQLRPREGFLGDQRREGRQEA